MTFRTDEIKYFVFTTFTREFVENPKLVFLVAIVSFSRMNIVRTTVREKHTYLFWGVGMSI